MMALHTEEVHPQHELSRHYKFEPRVHLVGKRFHCFDHIVYAAAIAQHGVPDEVRDTFDLLINNTLKNEPGKIAGAFRTFLDENHVPIRAQWIFDQRRIMIRIMLELMEHHDNPFASKMHQLRNRFGTEICFTASNRMDDRIWSSGWKPRRIPPNEEYDLRPGLNMYGQALYVTYHHFFFGQVNGIDEIRSLHDYLTVEVYAHVSYNKTVAVLSDSTFKFAESIEGGSLWYQPGATCGQLAEAVQLKGINLADYRIVVIAASTNDAQVLNGEQQESSWERMRGMLEPLKNHPHTTVMFNSGIGYPQWHRVPEYTSRLRENFVIEFEDAENFTFTDWSIPSDFNFFLQPNGRAEERFLNRWKPNGQPDQKHPNAQGIRKMWRKLCQNDVARARGMSLVQIVTNSEPYKAGLFFNHA